MDIKCDNCGAMLQPEAGADELVCQFCGNKIQLDEENVDEKTYTADSIVPYNLNKDDVIYMARDFMTQGELAPDDLVQLAQIEKVEFLYYPVYLISGTYTSDWTVSFGYDSRKTTRVYDHVNKKWKYVEKTVTNWKPFKGVVKGRFSDYVCPAYDVPESDLGKRVVSLLSDMTMGTTKNFDNKSLMEKISEGYLFEPFACCESYAWVEHGLPELEKIIESKVKKNAQGDRQKDWRWQNSIKTNPAERVYLPVAVVTFTYKGFKSMCFVDGEAGGYEGSDLPVDSKKAQIKKNHNYGRLLSWAPLLLWIVFAFYWGANNLYGYGALILALIYGWKMTSFLNSEYKKVLEHSAKVRKALTNQRQAQDGKVDTNNEEIVKSFDPPPPLLHKVDLYLGYSLASCALVLLLIYLGT